MTKIESGAVRVAEPKVKMILFVPEFFFIPMKKIKTESDEFTNRTYFLHAGKIVGVGTREDAR